MTENSLRVVKGVIKKLENNGIEVLLGGGWAEEVLGIKSKPKHKDIDLFFIGRDLTLIERCMKANLKGHKTKFIYDGIEVEVVLIQKDEKGYFTLYYRAKRVLRWLEPLSQTTRDGLKCLSVHNLKHRRDKNDWVQGK